MPHHQSQQHQYRGQAGFFPASNNASMPGMSANGPLGGGGYGGNTSSHSNHPFDFDQHASSPSEHFAPQDGSRSRAPVQQHQQQDDTPGMRPLSETELIDAFANLDFDEGSRTALVQRLQAFQNTSASRQFGEGFGTGPVGFDPDAGQPPSTKRADMFSSGYNRDPNAFMFSPFSPSDSPLVGGKADLPNSQSSSSSLHLSHRQDEDGSIASKEAASTGKAERT